MRVKHGMVLAAGIGKRLQPLTLKMPKPLIEINNLTLIERAINLLIDFGVEEISVNVHYLAGQIEKFINEKRFSAKFKFKIWHYLGNSALYEQVFLKRSVECDGSL